MTDALLAEKEICVAPNMGEGSSNMQAVTSIPTPAGPIFLDQKTISIINGFVLAEVLDNEDLRLMTTCQKLAEKGIVTIADLRGLSGDELFQGMRIREIEKQRFFQSMREFGLFSEA